MEELFRNLPSLEPGTVWLAGAGPGDPGLLSVLALHGLRQAEVIVYDALVDSRILDLAQPGVILEYAGKRGGKPSAKQRDISLRLIELAREGRRVLRLKGGDPFVFGIVPGISAGVGGLAYAGIPVTHREVNSAVAFITGHDASGLVPDSVDWESLSRGAPVLVIYMALKHIEPIVERLLAAGRSPAEPVAVVSKATTAAQEVLESTLGRIVADVAGAGLEPPAMVVVGEAVRLRAGLDWLGALSGKRLIADPLGQKKRSESA
jgi:uroporphyrin-III C-methyltransferase